jgi:glycosyltransferase involved in cell wall biosynthesis
MRKIVGSWRAPGVSNQQPPIAMAALAEELVHTQQERVLGELRQGEFAAAAVGFVADVLPPREQNVEARGSAREQNEATPCVLVAGELLELPAATLAEAYARDPSCGFLERARGVFAGVVFDEARQRLVLFTDPLGLAPLYYTLDASGLVFASEQKIFARLPGRVPALAPRAVEEFLRLGHLPGDMTWLEHVQLLKPGQLLEVDLRSGHGESRSYFRLGREELPRYGSFDEAKRALSDAYQAAFARAARDLRQPRVLLSGDLESRLLLASSEAHGLAPLALSVGEEDSEDAALAQRVCAVRGTIQRRALPHPSDWLLSSAHLNYAAEGADLRELASLPLLAALGQGPLLHPALGSLLLGTRAIRGFDDLRASSLLRHARRRFTLTRALGGFAPLRFPFADADLWRAALRLDVSYLLHDRLRFELALELFPDYFARLPIAHSAGRTLAQLLAGEPAPAAPAQLEPPDPHAYLRADPRAERFLWELLTDSSALYARHVDAKPGHSAFWSFFQGNREQGPTTLLRYASLELWLRQLLEARFLPPQRTALPPAPSSSATPDVSIIVPAYNVEPYLAECLNSLCNQELPNVEILVVDDGSTDGTLALLERFAAVDARIRVIKSANAGVYHARNRALELARGRYISFVDADDYVHPAMHRLLLAAAQAHRADVVFCDVYQFDVAGEQRIRRNTLRFKPNVPLSLASAPAMIGDGFSTLWNRLYDHAFLRKHGLKFDERYRISADMLFLQELLAKAGTIVRVPRGLYYYRFATPNSLTSYEVRNAKYLVHLEITIELIDFWVRNKLFERYAQFILLRALRNFLWNTHIDEQRLREVFEKFHAYLRTLRVGPVEIAKLPPFERRMFQLLRAGDFAGFSREVRPYRAKMIKAKGGELTRMERLIDGVDALRARVKKSVKLRRDPEAGPGRYRVLWPAAQLGLMLDRGAPLSAPVSEPVAETDTGGVRGRLRGLRQRLFFEADLDKALALGKPAATKILHFSNAFSVPSETFTYDVITGLEDYPDLDNYVMCFDRQLVRERPFSKVIELYGGTRADLEAFAPRALDKIERVLARLDPEIVHCHFGWVGVPLVMWLAQRGRQRPVVITMHGTDVNMWPARHSFYADALKTIGEKPWVRFTTHTRTYRDKLVRLGVPEARIEVIPNSFDAKFLADARERAAYVPGDHLRVISVARMDIWKGHEYLIDGFAQFVREHYSNASLTLVGYGAEEAKLKAQVEALGIEERVRFYGRAAHHEVPVLLRNHDVYVQPSIRHPETLQEEGQPIAVLEAIATGMPVIVTNTGGMAETVKVGDSQGLALIVPDRSGPAIAGALAALLTQEVSPERRRAYVAAICAKHARERQLAHTRRVYEHALASPSEPRAPDNAVSTPSQETP